MENEQFVEGGAKAAKKVGKQLKWTPEKGKRPQKSKSGVSRDWQMVQICWELEGGRGDEGRRQGGENGGKGSENGPGIPTLVLNASKKVYLRMKPSKSMGPGRVSLPSIRLDPTG